MGKHIKFQIGFVIRITCFKFGFEFVYTVLSSSTPQPNLFSATIKRSSAMGRGRKIVPKPTGIVDTEFKVVQTRRGPKHVSTPTKESPISRQATSPPPTPSSARRSITNTPSRLTVGGASSPLKRSRSPDQIEKHSQSPARALAEEDPFQGLYTIDKVEDDEEEDNPFLAFDLGGNMGRNLGGNGGNRGGNLGLLLGDNQARNNGNQDGHQPNRQEQQDNVVQIPAQPNFKRPRKPGNVSSAHTFFRHIREA